MANLPQPTQFRAAIYCSVSTDEQAERGHSLDAQERDCRTLAAELGAEVVEVFIDAGVSGSSWDAPALTSMLSSARRAAFELLIVFDPDRLARRMSKQLVIEEELACCDVSIRYVTLRTGDSPEDALLKHVRGAIAEYEKAKIALRTQRGVRAQAERGMVVGTVRPAFGLRYVRDDNDTIVSLEPDPATAPLARRIFTAVADMPLAALARELDGEGIPSPTGGRWNTSSLLAILRNPVYRGLSAHFRWDRTAKRERDRSDWIVVPAGLSCQYRRSSTPTRSSARWTPSPAASAGGLPDAPSRTNTSSAGC